MSALARLLAQATPGPWCAPHDMGSRALRAEAEGHYTRLATFDLHRDTPFGVDGVANTRLAALAPDMARLLIDMVAFVRGDTPDDECEVPGCNDPWCCDHDAEALLARFAELEQRAAP